MTGQSIEFTSKLYVTLMQEIKVRLTEIDRLVRSLGEGTGRDSRTIIDLETCYLQIRLICESVALASLAAHHSDLINSDLLKQWNADRIFISLSKINPQCFPRAVRGERVGERQHHFSDAEPPAINRERLAWIYHQCSDVLHRGALKTMLKDQPKTYSVDDIKLWFDEIVHLIGCHAILVPHLNKAIVLQLWGNEAGDVTLSEAYTGAEFNFGATRKTP